MENTKTGSDSHQTRPEWLQRAIGGLYHKFDDELRRMIVKLISVEDPDPDIKLPKSKIGAVVIIITLGVVISYLAPHHAGSAFWIGALSINTVVAGGLLAFAPLIPERMPDIVMALINESVDGGLLKWQNGWTPSRAFEQLKTSLSKRQVWMTLEMTGNGLLLLMLNIVGFAVMIWLPPSTRIGVATALVALLVYTLVNLLQPLYGLRLWPTLWIGYRQIARIHAELDKCPVCRTTHAFSPEPLSLGPGTATTTISCASRCE